MLPSESTLLCRSLLVVQYGVFPGSEQFPSLTNPDYQSQLDRDPPILEQAFSNSFYGCPKSCLISTMVLLCLFHEYTDRNHCDNTRVQSRLPKRLRKWDIENDHEKDDAWGLNAKFALSMMSVAISYALILATPMTFRDL